MFHLMVVQTSRVLPTHININKHTHTHTHTHRTTRVLIQLSTNKSLSFRNFNDLISSRLCCRANGINLRLSGATATAAPLPLGEETLTPAAAECWPARAGLAVLGETVPRPELLMVNHLLPGLLVIGVTHLTGRRAGSPVVRLVNN